MYLLDKTGKTVYTTYTLVNSGANMTSVRTSVHWTEVENNRLQELYGRALQNELLAALPGRTWVSICRQARILGLKRSTYYRYIRPL